MALIDATTLARVKLQLGIETADDTHDTIIDTMIDAVSKQIQSYIGRSLSQEARTEEYDVSPRMRTLFLREFPVTVLTSIKNSTDWSFSSVDALDSALYHLISHDGRVILNFVPAPGPKAFQVVYTAGLATNTTNLIANYPDIVTAADFQVTDMWQKRDDPGTTVRALQGSREEFVSGYRLLHSVKELLSPYKRRRY